MRSILERLLFPDKSYVKWVFLGLLVTLSLFYKYLEIMPLSPQGMHAWRQADCASLAYGYIDENNLFEPQMHNQLGDNYHSGKTAGEFPILYYVVGKLWSVFGHHDWIFRAVVVLLFLYALFRLYQSLSRHVDRFWGAIGALFLFTSPLLIYYGNNFLSNVPSLSFAILGWAIYLDFRKDRKSKQWIILSLYFAMAGLLKVTGLVGFLAIGGTEFFLLIFNKEKRIKWITYLSGMILGTGLVLSWYYYAKIYNNIHGGYYTFNDLWPIWKMTSEEIGRAISFFNDITFYQLLAIPSLVLLVLILIRFIAKIKEVPKDLLLITTFSMIGFTLYILFWFNSLEYHDYYFINVMLFPLIVFTGWAFMEKKTGSLFVKRWPRILALVLITLSILYCRNNIKMRYWDYFSVNQEFAESITATSERNYWHWISHDNFRDVHFKMDSVLQKAGIDRDDEVVSLPDPSFNITLYNMNRKGWSAYDHNMDDPNVLQGKIDLGAKCLIITNGPTADYSAIEQYLKDTLVVYKNAVVYDLTRFKKK